MRMSRLAEWVAGGVAGCPGTVDTTAPDDPPATTSAPQGTTVSAAISSTKHHRRRGRWVTAAAVILVVYGGLGILYVPFLMGGSPWPIHFAEVLVLSVLVLHVAAGIGLLRLHGWARLTAGAISSFGLLFMYAPALMAVVANGAWNGINLPGLVGYLVVLFAVLRRWPAEPTTQNADARTR
jgi:hypothetical protein